MSVIIDGTNGVNASGGLYAQTTYGGSYTDGIVVDYVTGNGRVTVGSADGITWYNGGPSSRSQLMTINSSGNLTITGLVDATTPNIGSTGGVRVRGNATSGYAYVQYVDSTAASQWGYQVISSAGELYFTNGSNNNATAFSSASTFGFKNRLINGNFSVWQRGTSFTQAGNAGVYTADRWYEYQSASSNATISQSTDVPAGFQYSLSMAGTGISMTQRIESLNCKDLGGANVTLSFWAKNSSGSDNLQVNLYTATAGADNYATQTATNYVLSASPSGSWTYYSYTFASIPSTATNGVGIGIGRGSSGASTTLLAGIQLEKGGFPTSFDWRAYNVEFDMCRRYCEVFNSDVECGLNQGLAQVDVNNRPETALIYYPKRIAPTVTVTNPTSVSWSSMANTSFFMTSYGGTYVGTGVRGSNLFFGVSSGVTAGTLSATGYIVLQSGASIKVDAEI